MVTVLNAKIGMLLQCVLIHGSCGYSSFPDLSLSGVLLELLLVASTVLGIKLAT
jgi:hypothetical protein